MLTQQQLNEFLGSGPRRIHFVGIGGSGMSALARIVLQLGHIVTGSDLVLNDETDHLRKLGVRIHEGHAAGHIGADTELVVFSSAVHELNNELQATAERNIPIVRRGILLSALMNHRNNVAVVGTHGKTTTTSMITYVLARSDSVPSFCIGAPVPCLGTSSQLGDGEHFVAETDESDGTLLGFRPDYSVCLNIEAEHLDYYGSMDKLLATFESFLANVVRGTFYCADCPNCVRLHQTLRSAISFGLSAGADYRAVRIEPTACGSRFTMACRDQQIGTVELVIPGRQNVLNALAAIAVARQLGKPFVKIAAALGQFTGAKRRFERKFEGGGILVIEDYAHHPTEIRETLAAARSLTAPPERAGNRRILVAFQPHRYTRSRALRDQFATAFADADRLFLTDIFAANEQPIEGVNGQTLLQAVVAAGQREVVYEPDFGKLTHKLLAEARPGDLILVIGAGDICKVANALAAQLSSRRPNRLPSAGQPKNIEADLRALCSHETKIVRDEPMSRHTTIRIGGPAEFWLEPVGECDLAKLLRYGHERQIPVTVVGRGSNLLVSERGIQGLVFHLVGDGFRKLVLDGQRIIAGSGARLSHLVRLAWENQLGGLEFLEGIPGSVGGALRMNAGAMGQQTFDVVERVRYISYTGEIYDAAASALSTLYRSCPVFADHVVLSAIFRGEKTPQAVIEARLHTFETRRRSMQPAKPSAGCVFKNPATIAAGTLIEELGLKGLAVGGAKVSEVHANFIVNEGGATADDVLLLIAQIRERAWRERGIDLKMEVMILGKEDRRGAEVL